MLLTDAEVRGVFPNAKPGKRERRNEQYGMSACLWDYPGGRFAAQLSSAKPGSVERDDSAMLITQRGDRQLMLSSTTLGARDRVAALKALEVLGRAAANRL